MQLEFWETMKNSNFVTETQKYFSIKNDEEGEERDKKFVLCKISNFLFFFHKK